MKWTHTVEAVVDAESAQAKSQWRIGDAIAKDLKFSDSENSPNFTECSSLLADKGYERYTANYLYKLHTVATAFPRGERDERYSWDVHFEAGTPENLKQAATALRKLGKTIVQDNVRWLMREWREKADAERRKENEAAKREEAAAKKEAAKAAERALRAKDKAEKEKAKQERAAAKQKAKEAKERKKQTASAPTYNTDVAAELQDEGTLRAMAVYFGITLHAKKMQNEARNALKDLDKIAEHLTPVQIKEITDAYQQVIDLCQQIKAKARGRTFHVHEGGAA